MGRLEKGRAATRTTDLDGLRLLGDERALGEERLGVPEDLVERPARIGGDDLSRLAAAHARLDLPGAEGLQGHLQVPWKVVFRGRGGPRVVHYEELSASGNPTDHSVPIWGVRGAGQLRRGSSTIAPGPGPGRGSVFQATVGAG